MKFTLRFAFLLLLSAAGLSAQTVHNHINAGVLDANSNGIADTDERLTFVNGANFEASSGFQVDLTWRTSGVNAGTYSSGSSISFTALAATPSTGGPAPGHAALGTRIVMQLVSVIGPEGGTFSFWEAGAPAASLAVGGSATSDLRWDLSENNGLPGEDPFGHIHGRQFTVDQPGTYIVTFQLFDASTNGVGGGPIHQPSETFQMKFVAVPEPGVVALVALGVVVMMAGRGRRQV